MKYPVFCIRDTKVGFDPTFMVQVNDEAGIRGFEVAINNPSNIVMNFRPADYEFYKIGYFETDNGRFYPLEVPEFMIGGVDAYAKS